MKCPQCNSDIGDDSKFCKECGTNITSAEEAHPPITKTIETPREEMTTGSTFAGRYQIIEELGKGGMGKVYRVLDTKLNEEVALKLIKPDIASDRNTIERFKNELKLARKIREKNVGSMYELLEDKGIHFITMEYVSGEDLKSFIHRSGQLTVGKTIAIAEQICAGLTEAHRLGVVHRDLKPSNIMIDKDGNARIMDFGIARAVKGKSITGPGVMIGTPQYMSPEQVEAKEVDQRSDIYSLGVILYEMLTGQLPFEGETPLAIAMKHKGEEPKNPTELNPNISEDFSRVILKCLEKDKEERYQKADLLLEDISNIEQGLPKSEKEAPKRKSPTSREITVSFPVKKLIVPALVVLTVVIAGLFIWSPWSQDEEARTLTDKPSIAVLPFNDLSPQKDQESLCEGFAESLISALVKIKDLRVPASTSCFFFKGKEWTLQEISRELDVKTVLEGSVQKSGDRIRITVKLVNAKDGDVIWTEQYDRVLDDVFSIQDDISFKIVDNLKINLLGEEKEELTKRYTENPEAYQAYLKGRYYWNRRTAEGFQKGIEHFEQAIGIDPTYALAYTGIADSYNLLGWHDLLRSEDVYPKAKRAAEAALKIDDTLAEAHASLAYVKMLYDWDWLDAEREFKRAIELNPNYAAAHQWFSEYLKYQGKTDEAITEAKRAQGLDPLSLSITFNMGLIFYDTRMYDRAIEEYKKALDMDPNFIIAHNYLGLAYAGKEMYDAAIAAVQKAINLSEGQSPLFIGTLGFIYSVAGKREEAEKILDKLLELSQQRYIAPASLAAIYGGLGLKDQAFEWLEKAYEVRDDWMMALKTSERLDSLRQDPRFKGLLKKMNLE